jgi:hypothetical protein
MSLKIIVIRSRLSLSYMRDPAKPAAYDNNDGNNSLDQFTLFDGDTPLFSCRAQTVSNLEGLDAGVHYMDTVAPGPFTLDFQVPPRAFQCKPNGICNTKTLAGDIIGADCTTLTNKSRWLNHDWEFPAGSGHPPGQDTRVAWSAGCFVVPDLDLRKFNATLINLGIQPGDLIDGILEMEA